MAKIYFRCFINSMAMVSDYKSYKKFAPEYSSWKSLRNNEEAKRLEYLRQNPSEITYQNIQKGKILIRAINTMDEYSQKRAEDMEMATEQVIGMVGGIVGLVGAGIGLLFKDNKTLKKLCSKFVKPENLKDATLLVATGAGTAVGVMASSIPLYPWAAKKEVQASRKGRFEAMRKELSDSKTFAVLTAEQERQLQDNLNKLASKKEKKSLSKSFKESLDTIKEMTTETKDYRRQRFEFNQRLNEDKKYLNSELTPEEIDNAKQDQQILTKLVEKIDIASQDYAENAELATNTIAASILALGALFSLGYEKLAAKMKWKSSAIPHILSLGAMLGISIFSAQIQKEASRVGRYKVKQELLRNPEQLVYVSDEKTQKIVDIKIKPDKKLSMLSFLKEAWKNNKEYQKWKKTEGEKEKKLSKALESIELSDEQIRDAKRLQHNTFKTFNKVDEKSQKYSESIEALGMSIQTPVAQACGLIGSIFGFKYLLNMQSSKSILPGLMKYMTICLLSSLPAIGINAYITKEQKKASRVADMLAIKELNDYRSFADFTRLKNQS